MITTKVKVSKIRDNLSLVLYNIGVLECFSKFAGRHSPETFTNQACIFLRKRIQGRCILLHFATFLRTPYSQNTSERLLLSDIITIIYIPLKNLFLVCRPLQLKRLVLNLQGKDQDPPPPPSPYKLPPGKFLPVTFTLVTFHPISYRWCRLMAHK